MELEIVLWIQFKSCIMLTPTNENFPSKAYEDNREWNSFEKKYVLSSATVFSILQYLDNEFGVLNF